jgi:hypothetical protein
MRDWDDPRLARSLVKHIVSVARSEAIKAAPVVLYGTVLSVSDADRSCTVTIRGVGTPGIRWGHDRPAPGTLVRTVRWPSGDWYVDGSPYAQGDLALTVTFATPGDLAVTYAAQEGRWIQQGSLVFLQARITTATFTHTTASGLFRLDGLPRPARDQLGGHQLSGYISGWTKAGYTQAVIGTMPGDDFLTVAFTGSGQPVAAGVVGDFPTTATIDLTVSGWYETS